jgi:MSHA biogenesis protein MshL
MKRSMNRMIRILSLTLSIAGVASAQDTDNSPRFDFHVEDAPARAFFEGLVVGSPVNMMVHPDVKGRVTLTLKQVTLTEALEAARDMYGYDFRPMSHGYVIMAPAPQTRVFQLNYLDMQRLGVSRTRVSSGQVTQGSSQASGTTGGTDDEKTQTSSTTGTAVLTRNDSDFWKGIETDIAVLVSGEAKKDDEKTPGNVVINRQSGVIVVRAFPEQLRAVADYLRKTQSTITRQVVLEAKVVEVELNSGFQAGINWTALVTKGNKTGMFGQSTPPGGFDQNPFAPQGGPVVVAPGNPTVGQVVNSLGGAFSFAFDSTDFAAFIELLDSQGRTRVLSSPRVSTLHNQKAIIKAGTDEFFVTGVSSDTTTGESTTTSLDVELTPFFSGVALDVTPQISDDGTVLMHIHPTVSDVQDQSKRISFGGSTSDLPLAVSQIRESDSVVRAHSGQVIVIGGLMREIRQRDDYKTPFLGDVPGLGNLFKSKRDLSTTVELVLLLRPVIVDDANMEALVRESTERAAALSRKGDVEDVR